MNSLTMIARTAVVVATSLAVLLGASADAEAKRKRAVPDAAELAKVVGPKDTFSPKLLDELKVGMTPKEVRSIFRRFGKVSVYGYAKARVKGFKGVKEVRFHFEKALEDDDRGKRPRNRLRRATIVYKGWLRNRVEFFDRMLALATAKWGAPKDQAQVQRKIITWIDESKTNIVQFARIGDTYELSLELH